MESCCFRGVRSVSHVLRSRPPRSLFRSRVFSASISTENVHSGAHRVKLKPENAEWKDRGVLKFKHYSKWKRYMQFSIPGLVDVVATALGVPKTDVLGLQHFKGSRPGVFDIHLRNNRQVLVHIKQYYPGQESRKVDLEVASAVATTDLLRSLGIPVPRVLDYSATWNNPVCVPYAMTERPAGKTLNNPIFELTKAERDRYVVEMAKHLSNMASVVLPAFGSIYYQRDLEPGTPREPIADTDDLCVGPFSKLLSRARWINPGPLKTADEVFETIAKDKFKMFARNFPVGPLSNTHLAGFTGTAFLSDYHADPDEYYKLLGNSIDIIPRLMTERNQELLRPTLLPTTGPYCTMVSPGGESLISGLVGFQGWIQPFCKAVELPLLRRGTHYGSDFPVPVMPENQARNLEPSQLQTLYKHLIVWHQHSMERQTLQTMKEGHPNIHKIITSKQAKLLSSFMGGLTRRWAKNNTPLEHAFIEVMDNWEILTSHESGKIPFEIPEEQRQRSAEQSRLLALYAEEMKYLLELAMLGRDGSTASGVDSFHSAQWRKDLPKTIAAAGYSFLPLNNEAGYPTTTAGQTGPGIYPTPDDFERALCDNLGLSRHGLREKMLYRDGLAGLSTQSGSILLKTRLQEKHAH